MKRGIVSALIGMVLATNKKPEAMPSEIEQMRARNLRDAADRAGITRPRAVTQRQTQGDLPAVPDRKDGETRKEKKARLIAKGTASLMRRGYSRKEAEAIAKRSYAEAVRSVGNAAQGH